MTLEQIIDREKRRRENALLGFLLTLTKRARRHAYAAVRVGADPWQAIADVFTGNPMLGIPSPAPMLAGHLGAAESTGYHRTELILPHPLALDAAPKPVKSGRLLNRAGQWLGKMLGTVQRRVGQAVSTAKQGVAGRLRAIRQAFTGYTPEQPHAVEAAAEAMVGQAYSDGYAEGWQRPEAMGQVRGFRFSATLDEVTTSICRTCHGVKVLAGDPWLSFHSPPLHFNCRSVLVPIFRDFDATNPLPVVEPMAGFGRAPFALIGRVA